jgi:FtsP/CotA-like multicopper oxidase with cupredoxin domain
MANYWSDKNSKIMLRCFFLCLTLQYNWVITNTTMSPDGTSRQMMVVNGQYPGPAIYADWGDTIQVTVQNNLQDNGTSIHWHGIRQLNSSQMDGTPGISECPIPPGGSRTYTFQATQYGTCWYHSRKLTIASRDTAHFVVDYSVQYGGGVLGPIIINGPSTANWDIDVGALPLTDWYHEPIFTAETQEQHATGPLTADNALVNGTMVAASGTGGAYAVTTLTPGKKHLLRIVNTGINQYFRVSIDPSLN